MIESHDPNAIKIFSNADEVAAAFAEDFFLWSEAVLQRQDYLTVALSGGSTPKKLFELWGRNPDKNPQPCWNRIHFFWGDERCVPPTDEDSNYRVAHELWLSKIDVDSSNIHRVFGEAEPNQECRRYSDEITQHAGLSRPNAASESSTVTLDLVILGMGPDGHIASIFPDRLELFHTAEICAVATHPVSGQKRITLSGQLILQASRIVFLITGADKAAVIKQVFDQVGDYQQYPFAHVKGARVEYFLDQAAASKLR
jgi:6-phosphogluconolactonase